MVDRNRDRDAFLVPIVPLAGSTGSVFDIIQNHNLQEFSIRAGYICGLESNGTLAPEEAWLQIQALWRKLKAARKEINKAQQQFQAASAEQNGTTQGGPQASAPTAPGAPATGSPKKKGSDVPLVIVGPASILDFAKELQRFAWQLSIVCALEAGGKITPEEAYRRIRVLYKGMKRIKKRTFPKPPEAPFP